MTRRKKDPLRTLTEEEHTWLERISRSQSEPASHVARAKQVLHVANGTSYQEAALLSGLMKGVRRRGRQVPTNGAEGQQEHEGRQGPSPATDFPACSSHDGATIGGGPAAVNLEDAGPPAAGAGDASV